MDKTLTVAMEEFKQNLISTIQNSELPIVVVDLILKDLYNEIHSLASEATIREMREYNRANISV